MHSIFEWDPGKEIANRRKHGISFYEATTAFYDPDALYKADPDHSIDEERFLLIGMSETMNLLVISHCYRSEDRNIRIISARRADAEEAQDYRRKLQ